MADNKKYEIKEATAYKSNTLITSKYSMNARSLKILTACFSKLNPFDEPPKNGTSISLSVKEVKELLDTKSHSIYDQMKNIRDNIGSNNTIFYEDEVNERTGFFVLVESCEFDVERGITINFGKTATPFLYEIQKTGVGFTKLKIATILNLSSSHAIRFYELFKKVMFKISKDMPYIEVEYGINELKFILGLIDLNSKEATECRRMLNQGEKDYDKIIEAYKGTVPYIRIDNFKKRVINVAQKELEEMTEIRFEYEPIKRSRTITGFRFKIFRNVPKNADVKKNIEKLNHLENISEDDVIDFIIDLIEEKRVKVSEARQIAIAADYQINYIAKAYELSKQQKNIDNICGWLVACLNNNYENIKEESLDFDEVMSF